jgi:NAD(P) transhydrogenase
VSALRTDKAVDIFGGFLITKRMLDLFKRPTDPPEYGWLYTFPAAVFGMGFVWAASSGVAGLVQAGYFVSTMLSIGALTGLSSQVSREPRCGAETLTRRLG